MGSFSLTSMTRNAGPFHPNESWSGPRAKSLKLFQRRTKQAVLLVLLRLVLRCHLGSALLLPKERFRFFGCESSDRLSTSASHFNLWLVLWHLSLCWLRQSILVPTPKTSQGRHPPLFSKDIERPSCASVYGFAPWQQHLAA